jgi:hypothetical protein
LVVLFATIGPGTPVWVIVTQGAFYGIFQSLQMTSMNTLVYADIPRGKESNASSIASTLQQLSLSFGVAGAGVTTALFIPNSVRADPVAFINGLHAAFLALGIWTALSTIVFWQLRASDGNALRQQKDVAVSDGTSAA